MVKLTVTIPTYNRPSHIQRQVRDVLDQLRPNVNLVVYDNCSDIPVAELFTEDEKQLFRIERNPINIGGRGNIGKCFAQNPDGWIWLLGDDDQITNDAVSVILDTIEHNKDCCYINFQNKVTEKTDSYNSFLNHFKVHGAFGVSFFQSACLFNMDKVQGFVPYYYDYISTWVGQIVLVVKYMEANPDDSCFFTEKRIITDNPPGDWAPHELIVNLMYLKDKFRYSRKIMRPNFFKALGDTSLILLPNCRLSFYDRLYYLRYIAHRVGYINLIRYNFLSFWGCVMHIILPSKVFGFIHKKATAFYKHSLTN